MTNKRYLLPTIAITLVLSLGVLLGGGSAAHADTSYTVNGVQYNVPTGYQPYTQGTFFNSSTGMYYNPLTGQTSMTAPTGAGSLTAGSYTVPTGYQFFNYGTYYNPATGTYLNPITGQTSQTAPTGPVSLNASGGYVIPAGYTTVSLYGTYYNPTTGMYFDPVTGFTSPSAPAGPTYNPQTTYRAPNGTIYAIPSGYTASTFGTFYNSSTGLYYDPVTGFTSSSAPTGPTLYSGAGTGGNTATPGLPNTGAGSGAMGALALFVLLTVAGVGGAALIYRKSATS